MTTGSSRARARGRAAAKPGIDREKLAAAVECLNDAAARALLSECLSLLPDYKVAEVVRGYVDPGQLRPDATGPDGMRSVLHDVRAFDAASRSGEYYESFDVNSRNFMEESGGTKAFIAECNLLFGRCVRSAPSGEAQDACEAFETLFDILLHIDEGNDDIVFLADEAGSWRVGACAGSLPTVE